MWFWYVYQSTSLWNHQNHLLNYFSYSATAVEKLCFSISQLFHKQSENIFTIQSCRAPSILVRKYPSNCYFPKLFYHFWFWRIYSWCSKQSPIFQKQKSFLRLWCCFPYMICIKRIHFQDSHAITHGWGSWPFWPDFTLSPTARTIS